MSSRNRIFLIILPLLAAAIAFWLLLLSPKREEAAELEVQASDLSAQVAEQEQLAVGAEAARKDFPRAYRRLVVLGKAAPEDDDTSSLLVQLDTISRESGVRFISLTTESSGEEAPPPAPVEPQTPAQTAAGDEQRVENVEQGQAATVAPPPPATETQASLLPIGASIGPAGLPVMRYALNFEGDFFKLADFVDGLDAMVRTDPDGRVGVRGRLITVDSFELSPVADTVTSGTPELSASFTITTFLTPADEGATAGASPTGPAPPTAPQPVATAPPSQPSTTASTTAP